MVTPQKTARTLLRANRQKRNPVSWRTISKRGYELDDIKVLPGVAHGTLCRFAKSKGTWLPTDKNILTLLGLYHEKQPRPKSIWDMSSAELLHCLTHRKEYQPTLTQKQLREYVRACKQGARAS